MIILITQEEFKFFLHRRLGKSQVFVNIIWTKIYKNFQYQREEVIDWATHMKYL